MASNDDFLKNLTASAKIQKQLTSSVGEYAKAIATIGEIQENIKIALEGQKAIEADLLLLRQEEQDLINKMAGDSANLTEAERRRLANLAIIIRNQQNISDELVKQTTSLNRQNDEYIQIIKNVSKVNLGVSTVLKSLTKVPGLIKKGFGALDDTGIFKVDKEIKLTSRSLNISKANSDAFGLSLNKAAKSTSMIGVQTEDLSKMQKSYSEEIGRSVVLSEEGLVAMSRMAQGTNLGTEGAAAMAAEMDKFNLSVEASADYVEETVKLAAKMGVNSDKAIKNLQTNLKLAQKFNFKGGVAGITMMANEAARLRLDMDGISGLADKVFRPEGAVEMAAQLQVMGGEFAKLGDPFTLMFKARNDFAGFAKDISKATVEFVDFNDETGETILKGGLAADRMREISKITGIATDKLVEMAGAQKRLEKFDSIIPSVISDKEDREMIASLATMKDGKAEIVLSGGEKFNLKDITDSTLKYIKANDEGLKERAEGSRSFDENITDFKNTMKSTFLPLAQTLAKDIGPKIQGMVDYLRDNDWFGKIETFMKGVGSAVTTFGDIFSPKGLLIAGIATLIAQPALWVIRGLKLAKGFMSGVRGMGGIGDGKTGSRTGSSGSGMFNTSRTGAGMSKSAKMGMNFKSASKGIGSRLGGLTAAGFSGYDEWSENSENGMGDGENATRTAARAGGAGLGAWGGAAAGAAIGSVVPVIGTIIGGIIGGIAGGALGDYVGDKAGDIGFGSSGKPIKSVDDGIISFNPNDKFMSVGSDAMIAGTNVNGNKKLAETISTGGSGGSSEVKHKFDDLNINISLNSDTAWLNRIGSDIANDRTFVRELTIKIQEEIRMAIGGGKLNPNPI